MVAQMDCMRLAALAVKAALGGVAACSEVVDAEGAGAVADEMHDLWLSSAALELSWVRLVAACMGWR